MPHIADPEIFLEEEPEADASADPEPGKPEEPEIPDIPEAAPEPEPAPVPQSRPAALICPKCGNKMNPNASFCNMCGQPLT